MFNVFQLDYKSRFQAWYDLRNQLKTADVKNICCEVDKFWQQAPLVNHYLHPSDISNWPTPWELMYDNTYCYIARGLGIYYTLVMLGLDDIDFSLALDDNTENVAIVMVDHAKYILNYWPGTVLNNSLQRFKITSKLDITKLKNKVL